MIQSLRLTLPDAPGILARIPGSVLNAALALAAVGVLGLGLVLDQQTRSSAERRQQAEVLGEVNLLKASLEGLVKGDVQLLRGLAAAIEVNPEMAPAEFERLARRLLDRADNIRLVAAAPDLIVRMIHPAEGNEALVGLDYRAINDQWEAVQRVVDARRLLVAGPLALVQGGEGLVARAPVVAQEAGDGRLWGIVSAVIDVAGVWRASGLLAADLPVSVALRGRDGLGGDGEVFFGLPEVFDARPVTAEVVLPEGRWIIAAVPQGGWRNGSGSGWTTWFAVVGFGGLVLGPLSLAARLAEERRRTIGALEDRERELERLSRRLDLALAASTVGVWDYNIDRDELVWDARMNELYGMPEGKAEHAYRDWRERLHPDDIEAAEATFAAAFEGRARYETQFRLRLPGDAIRHIRAIGAVYRDGDGTSKIVGLNWDATPDMERESELVTKRREAEAASVAKSRFLAAMSHEIRTPMSGVLGMLELLLDSPLDAEQRGRAEVARASATTLLAILDDILDLSKLEADRFQLDPAQVRIGSLVHEVVALFAPMAEQKALAVTVEMGAGVPEWLVLDPVRLRQIVVNLLSNALKFTDAGQVRVHVDYVPRTARLTIAVADSGIGIAPADAARLFQPFSQLDGGIDRRAGGTGLGLAISHRLAALMGGTIEVESVPGAGSTFTLRILAPRGRAPEAAPPEVRLPSRPLAVLLVEDNRTNQMVVTAMLERAGHAVTAAEDGLEALEALDRGRFDVVIMDIEMPRMDGPAATRAIRALPGPEARLPIIALTANAMSGDRERYLAMGMTDYLSKPVAPKALHAALAGAQEAGEARPGDGRGAGPVPDETGA